MKTSTKSSAQKRSPDLARLKRAATEVMHIVAAGRPKCFYVSSKGGTYLVDTAKKTCTCADYRNRILKMRRQGKPNAECKHLIRVNSKPNALRSLLLYATDDQKKEGHR
jgi:hypothetical protein